MLEVVSTDDFDKWLRKLKDRQGKLRIVERVDRLAHGNPGDVRPVGQGVSEMRLTYGPGYRLYFVKRGTVVIVMLCGGDKRSQDADIKRARNLAKEA